MAKQLHEENRRQRRKLPHERHRAERRAVRELRQALARIEAERQKLYESNRAAKQQLAKNRARLAALTQQRKLLESK